MDKLEKAIKGITCHLKQNCTGCPYEKDFKSYMCIENAMHDDLELLKEEQRIVHCKDCRHQSTCIHSRFDNADGEGFCKWGKPKDSEQK